ncbi:MAG TPA: recombinase family protein [Candidatus Acidoferrales bacterium]|jgi:hypothetical protein|nr:recombinase family protein [Candidatus Acidoferrales bacterium]
MAKREHVRETVKETPGGEYWKERAEAGWRLVAVEWERETRTGEGEAGRRFEVPFGLKVAADCEHLEENEAEMQVLLFMMELVVRDVSLSRMADELNQRGYRTRQGMQWTPVEVFNMLPRLVEVGPWIFSDEEWMTRRKAVGAVAWNS